MASRSNRRNMAPSSRKDASDLPKRPLSQEPSTTREQSPRSSGSYDAGARAAFDASYKVRDLNLASARRPSSARSARRASDEDAPKSPKFPYKSQNLDSIPFDEDQPSSGRGSTRYGSAARDCGVARAHSSFGANASPADRLRAGSRAYRASDYRLEPATASRASTGRSFAGRYDVRASSHPDGPYGARYDDAQPSRERTASRYTVSADKPHNVASRHDPTSFYAKMFEEDPRAVYAGAQPQASKAAAVATASGGFFKGVGHIIGSLWQKSRAAVLIMAVVLVAIGAFVVDGFATANRIHNGVHVGTVDVSGLTVDEAAAAINDNYGKNLFATSVYIFADDETASSADIDMHLIESESLAEQLSFEEAQAQKKLWITSASDLNAEIPATEIAEEAYAIGRDEGGIFGRLGAMLQGTNVDVHANFDETLLSNLISDINSTLGSEVRDFGVEVDDGEANVTSGNDGYMLDSEDFTNSVNDALLADEESIKGFVAEIEYTNYRIDEQSANDTCDVINSVVPEAVEFVWEGRDYSFGKQEMMSWVSTRVAELPEGSGASTEGKWYLEPYLSTEIGVPAIIGQIIDQDYADFTYTLEHGDGEIYLQPSTGVELPVIDEALAALDDSLFGEYRQSLKNVGVVEVEPIEIESRVSADRMTIEEAMSYGLVKEFSSYTTMYTNTKSTANRTYNVHLAADKIDNSIVSADGKWSFNEVAGSCDEAAGFTEANVINSGEYTQAFGGGICQVATTVFNAVYNAGLKINERHNHTLYSSSYPAGLDAAIAYPNWDLVWTNTTGSDMVLVTSYTDTSVTVKLIGRDPNRKVTTMTGDWVDGAKHTTKYEEDPALAANSSYVKTAGTDGLQISVSRRVTDESGEVLYEDNFYSSYSPIQRVIVFGPGTDMAALRVKYAEES